MAREVKKVNVAVGEADLYTAPLETVKPEDALAYRGDFADFEFAGGTEDGVTLTFGRETTEHRLEEDPFPALITVNSATFSLAFGLGEDTFESMKLAYGGGTITSAAGKRTFALAAELEELAILMEAKTADGGHRRIYIPRMVATGEVGTPYRRSEGKRMYPVTLQSLCALSEISIEEFPAPVPAGV